MGYGDDQETSRLPRIYDRVGEATEPAPSRVAPEGMSHAAACPRTRGRPADSHTTDVACRSVPSGSSRPDEDERRPDAWQMPALGFDGRIGVLRIDFRERRQLPRGALGLAPNGTAPGRE